MGLTYKDNCLDSVLILCAESSICLPLDLSCWTLKIVYPIVEPLRSQVPFVPMKQMLEFDQGWGGEWWHGSVHPFGDKESVIKFPESLSLLRNREGLSFLHYVSFLIFLYLAGLIIKMFFSKVRVSIMSRTGLSLEKGSERRDVWKQWNEWLKVKLFATSWQPMLYSRQLSRFLFLCSL